MLTFSKDGPTADKQMRAVIFYLTTFGYIDGDFDQSEKDFVRDYIAKLVTHRVHGAVAATDVAMRTELVGKYTAHFHEVFEGIDSDVKELFTESVAEGEKQDQFVHSKLKLRCFEIFKSFDEANQGQLLDTIDELIQADGIAHPAELKFRGELATLLEEDLGIELLDDGEKPHVTVTAGTLLEPKQENHPFFNQFEVHYSADAEKLTHQVESDLALLDRVSDLLDTQRAAGAGKLTDRQNVAEFAGGDPFLDGHVYVHPTKPGAEYELTVIGDLHGCYSCLKGAIMQANFIEKVNIYKADPGKHPKPLLILLGDYIDRGIFSYNGVLRAVLQVFCTAPDHVFVLRGNHEYYFEHKGRVYGGVKPAEAINTLKPHLPVEVFTRYMKLFDELPNMLLFEKFLFVHAGIPRDLLLKERYKDLSSLNDSDIRFQMMWSDPSSADVVPASLQEQSARFPFGRLQCLAFLQRIGCQTLVRGHEKVDEGFRRSYDDGQQLLITLFSSGGKDNNDLPPDSGYRSVSPMAMTVRLKDGESTITPWLIDYHRYNDPKRNAFFQAAPEILHRME